METALWPCPRICKNSCSWYRWHIADVSRFRVPKNDAPPNIASISDVGGSLSPSVQLNPSHEKQTNI